MGPQFRIVNAINDDTIYASSLYTDLRSGPVVVTIPATPDVYSILPLDVFGNTFSTSIRPRRRGPTRWSSRDGGERFPRGVTKVVVPYPVTLWLFRADKYSSTGVNMIRRRPRSAWGCA